MRRKIERENRARRQDVVPEFLQSRMAATFDEALTKICTQNADTEKNRLSSHGKLT